MMNRFIVAACLAMGVSLSAHAGGNIALGKQKSEEAACLACHGADGVKGLDASYPILAGQHPDFIERALLDYQRGARKNAIMSGIAAGLSKQDIKNLSAYYASLPGPLTLIK